MNPWPRDVFGTTETKGGIPSVEVTEICGRGCLRPVELGPDVPVNFVWLIWVWIGIRRLGWRATRESKGAGRKQDDGRLG